MEANLVMKRTKAGLEPANPDSADMLEKIKVGERVLVKVHRPRSIDQHRLFWSLLTKVAEASEFETPERLLVALKLALGRYDLMKLPSGKVVPAPHSISFGSMPQEQFRRFFDDAVRLICEHILPGSNFEELAADVHAMLDDTRRAA